MSVQHKTENKNNHYSPENRDYVPGKKVNLNDLVNRMNETRKQERKSNIILSAAAISAVTVFGIILTL